MDVLGGIIAFKEFFSPSNIARPRLDDKNNEALFCVDAAEDVASWHICIDRPVRYKPDITVSR